MNDFASCTSAAPRPIAPLSTWLDAARSALRALAIWRSSRVRARRDLQDLAHMTERELRDIGVCLGDIPAAANPHWSRDWPR